MAQGTVMHPRESTRANQVLPGVAEDMGIATRKQASNARVYTQEEFLKEFKK
jgi:hypothetical protein